VRLSAKSTEGEEAHTFIYVLTQSDSRRLSEMSARLAAFLKKESLPQPAAQGLQARWFENVGQYQKAFALWSSLAKAYPAVSDFQSRRDRLKERSMRIPVVAESLREVERWTRNALKGMLGLL